MDEYIKKADVLQIIESDAMWNRSFYALHDDIEDMTAAYIVPVRHGRWIEYTKVIIPEPYNKWEQAWKCSECGFDDGFVAYNYCPNCGAKMNLEDEDNG